MAGLMAKINLIARCAGMYRDEKFSGLDLGSGQQIYLFAVCREPGISQEQIARQICVNKSNVTRSLSQLEAAGYVVRRQSESDKRITRVYPTERALEILPTVRTICRDWSRSITVDLSDEERRLLDELLERMVVRARSYADNGNFEGSSCEGLPSEEGFPNDDPPRISQNGSAGKEAGQ